MSQTATLAGSAPAHATGTGVEPRGPRPKPFFTPRKIVIYSVLVFFSSTSCFRST